MLNDDSKDYHLSRIKTERAKIWRARCEAARRAHLELAALHQTALSCGQDRLFVVADDGADAGPIDLRSCFPADYRPITPGK